MSKATISQLQPFSRIASSTRIMASEYGSWPVEAAAQRMRNDRWAARFASSAGSTVSRKMVNGTTSRKNRVSLVVIASMTSAVSFASWRSTAAATAERSGSACLRITGRNRLSSR